MKNTDRALDIAKTLYGMVDEMDTTDFGGQRDSGQGIFNNQQNAEANESKSAVGGDGKPKTKVAENQKEADGLDAGRSSNIEELVARLEH